MEKNKVTESTKTKTTDFSSKITQLEKEINEVLQQLKEVDSKLNELSSIKAQLRDKFIYLTGQKDLLENMKTEGEV